MGGKKKYIEMFGSFMETFNLLIWSQNTDEPISHLQCWLRKW